MILTPDEKEVLRQIIKQEIIDVNLFLFQCVNDEEKKNNGNEYETLLSSFYQFINMLFKASYDDFFRMHEVMPDNPWAQFQNKVIKKHKGSVLAELSSAELKSAIQRHKNGIDMN